MRPTLLALVALFGVAARRRRRRGARPVAGPEAAVADHLPSARALPNRADRRRRRRQDPVPHALRGPQAEGRDAWPSSPGGGSVNTLLVTNKSLKPLLILGGEVVLGGQQDRILGQDTIVPSHEELRVQVFCVEHGRWSGGRSFSAAQGMADTKMRVRAKYRADQSQVWAEVAKKNAAHGAAPSTGTYRNLATGDEGKKALDPYRDGVQRRARQAAREGQGRRRGRRGQRARHVGGAVRQARAVRRLSRQAARLDLHGRRRCARRSRRRRRRSRPRSASS